MSSSNPLVNPMWVREVWDSNIQQEFELLRTVIERYPYVSMDTEFPGVVAKPIGNFRNPSEYHYQTLRCNVDLLNIIQLGITVSDEKGNKPHGFCTWQFNFKFNLEEDMFAQDSIDLLTKSGINFRKNLQFGIDPLDFAELLISSGLVLLDDIKWISFHSGYDFGYLLKILTCKELPKNEQDFFHLLHVYFPNLYDIKYMVRSIPNLKGGLQDIADELQISRIGPQHQAGSDSLLTSDVYFKLRQTIFENIIDDSRFIGHLFGLSSILR